MNEANESPNLENINVTIVNTGFTKMDDRVMKPFNEQDFKLGLESFQNEPFKLDIFCAWGDLRSSQYIPNITFFLENNKITFLNKDGLVIDSYAFPQIKEYCFRSNPNRLDIDISKQK